MFLSKNLKYLREQNNRLSQEALANELDITRSAVSSYEDGRAEPKLTVMNKIANFFKINLDQLLNIDLTLAGGNINTSKDGQPKKYASAQNLRVLTITIDDKEKENVELVSHENEQAYLTSYNDPNFLRELPKYQLPFLLGTKTHRAFELSTDAMLPLTPGSIVIAEFIGNWVEILDDTICIVVDRERGISLNKVFNHIQKNGRLLLKSTNINYRPYEVEATEILEIWKFSAYISKAIPQEQNTIQNLKNAFLRLEDEIRDIKEQQENKFGA